MVAIRLARTGAKKKPSYRVVVIDKRRARDSRNIEIVGHYNPRLDPIEIVLKRDRIDYWMGVGAQPSKTVLRLIGQYDERGPADADEPETTEDAPAPEVKDAEAATDKQGAAAEQLQPGQPTDEQVEDDSESGKQEDVEVPEDLG